MISRGVVHLNMLHFCVGCCRVISVLACGASSTAAGTAASLDITGSTAGSTGAVCGSCLAPAVVRELFIQLLLLSPQLTSTALKELLLQVMLHLVTTGTQGVDCEGCLNGALLPHYELLDWNSTNCPTLPRLLSRQCHSAC
jgi:hypothetical protein